MSNIFTLTTPRGLLDAETDTVIEVEVSRLKAFPQHPFSVKNDEEMAELVQSIKDAGVLVPLLVRPMDTGSYELISGHRRLFAAKAADLVTVPCIVREMDDDSATIAMVDSNKYRERILPSEKAFAYKMKLDALKHQGKRGTATSAHDEPKLTAERTRDIIAQDAGESGASVQRYISLTQLVPPLRQMVDDKALSINTGVELSHIPESGQLLIADIIDKTAHFPSPAQAKELRRLSDSGALERTAIVRLLKQEKKDTERLVISGETLSRYFPKQYTPRQRMEVIESLLAAWAKKNGRKMS